MANANLLLRIGGDISDAISKINLLQNRLTIFQNQISRLNKLSLTPGLNEAQQSRISNLIKQTQVNIESLSGAAKSAGISTGGLLANLFKMSLPLIGLAAGAAIIGKIRDHFAAAREEAEKARKKLEDFRKEMEKFSGTRQERISLAVSGSAADIEKVRQLSAAVNDQTLTLHQRQNAALQLREIDKTYFGQIVAGKTSQEELTKATNDYIDSLVNKAIIEAFAKDLADLSKLQAEQFNDYKKLQTQRDELNKKYAANQKAIASQTEAVGREGIGQNAALTAEQTRLANAIGNVNKQLAAQNNQIGQVGGKISDTKAIMDSAIKTGLDFKFVDPDALKAEKHRLEELKRIAKEEKKLRSERLKDIVKDLQEQTKAELLGGDSFIAPKFITEINFSDFDKIGQKVTELRANISQLQNINKNVAGTDLGEQIGKLKERLDVLTKLQKVIHDTSDDKKVEEFFKRVQERATRTADIISNSVGSAIGSMVDAFKSGENPIKSFFQSIGNEIIHLVGQLITAAIRAFVLKKILSIAFPGLGSIASSLFSSGLSLGGLAEGGPIGAGSAKIVGERGPEIFVPSVSGRIIPNNNLSSIRGGAAQMISVLVSGKISGRDILLSGAREGRYQGRNV